MIQAPVSPVRSAAAVRRTLIRLALAVAAMTGPLLAAEAPTSPPSRVDQLITHSATGIVLPGVALEADLKIEAGKANVWRAAGAHQLLLAGDVAIAIGSYGFKADRAFVRITPVDQPGRRVYDLAIYLDHVRELGGCGPIQTEARRLLVTGMIEGRVKLHTPLLERAEAAADPLAQAGLARILRFHQAVARNMADLPEGEPLVSEMARQRRAARRKAIRGELALDRPTPPEAAPVTPSPRPVVVAPASPATTPIPAPGAPPESPEPLAPTAPAEPAEPALPELAGDVDFGADQVIYRGGEDEDSILLIGNVIVMYQEPGGGHAMTFRADRAVVFTEPDAVDTPGARQAPAKAIRGVYLEDNVMATNGQYTLRGPRVFYDLVTDRAIVLEAVFYTWDVKRQVPLYVRARSIRQESRTQWSATRATVSTSEFAEPHFSLGAGRLTVRQETDSQGEQRYFMTAADITPRVGALPIGYWPYVAGEATDPPLRRADLDVNSREGLIVHTEWDLFGMLGQDKPRGLDASLIVDAYTKRGAGVGIESDYDVPKAFGNLDAYFLYDTGNDEPGGREDVEPPTETRGKLHWQHRHYVAPHWEVTAELGWISDPTFLEEFFPDEAYGEKPYETLLYAKNQEDDWAFTFLAQYDLMDFLPNPATLQAPGYGVDKLPEIAYYRIGTPLLGDRLTWFSENRASAMRLNLPDPNPRQYGFNAADAVALFGIANTVPFEMNQKNVIGLDEHPRYRADTRQELNLPMTLGPVDVVPYVVGRVTAFDHDFDAFSRRVGEDENVRAWGALGVRLHTAFVRQDDGFENALFDLHRMRHLIEPSVDLFFAEANVRQDDWPVYDNDVESINEGFAGRIGLRNTFQTQRGGPGRWKSVDFLRIDTDFIMHSDDTREARIGRFFGYRPEYSLAGDHFWSQVAAQLTDTFAVVGNVNYSFDRSHVEQWNLGASLQHDPRLRTFVQHRFIDAVDSAIVSWGFDYLLTPKYHVSFSHGYDFANDDSSNLSLIVTRRMPRLLVMVGFDYDPIDDETSLGISITPEGLGGSGQVSHNPFLR